MKRRDVCVWHFSNMRSGLAMSALGGKAEVAFQGRQVGF
jgi:hypothetical protein